MDPNATYEALNRAIAEGDSEGALEALEALTGWISSGGFFPFPLSPTLGTMKVMGENLTASNLDAGSPRDGG